jgi:hypothetical protein
MTRKKIYDYSNDQLNEVIDLIENNGLTLTAACIRLDMDVQATRRALDELGFILRRKPNKVNHEVRQTILVMFGKGYTFEEIAKATDLAVPTVYKVIPPEHRDFLKNAPAYVRFKKKPVLGLTAARVLGISYDEFVEQATEFYAKSILAVSKR